MDFNTLLKEEESEYLDFKEIYHDNNAKLVHDILCLANALYKGDRYLVFGITDDNEISGIEDDKNRKTLANILNLLKHSFLNTMPSLKLKQFDVGNKKIDILIINDKSEKPYFLIKDKRSGGTVVRAGVVYTRDGDTNTPLDSTADISKIEYMFRERFGIDKSPLERFAVYLNDITNWKYKYDDKTKMYFFYNIYPEFTVTEIENSRDFDEPWSNNFPDRHATSNIYGLKYQNTILEKFLVVFCDGGRKLSVCPERFIKDENENTEDSPTYKFYYFIRGSIKYLLNEMIQKVCLNMSDRKFQINIFDTESEAKEKIEKCFNEKSTALVYYKSQNTRQPFKCFNRKN